ncbi:phage holin family protein [Propionivibrio sp.]|uniref:phage holin family protein n=1 Tax=Propionivibrio sp. TaxID=2212460 RepID=UPI0025E90764|nr:phage holin family protein [Propionivibrio sp.]MBK8745677.1 phage holin family protein [Propionivibrio sp.]
MPEKDPTAYSFITYAWIVFLSAWGGAVSFLRKRRSGEARPFNIVELVGELMTSGLSGLITFWLCEASAINPLVTAALIGIAGPWAAGLFALEKWAERKFLTLP